MSDRSGRTFGDQQPSHGDTVLHCGHLGTSCVETRSVHWFKYETPVRFARPDGSRGQAEWLVACETCFVAHGDEVPVRGDGQWTGDAPIIETAEN